MVKSKNGSQWLDTYIEGYIYTLNIFLHDYDSDAPVSADPDLLPRSVYDTHPYFTELTIYWPRLWQEISLDFEGDGSL